MIVANINVDALHQLVTQEPFAVAGKQFGDVGIERLKGILRFIKICARHASVHEGSNITIFTLIQGDPEVDKLRLNHATAFQFGVSALGSINNLLVEIRQDNSAFIWSAAPVEIQPVLQTGIIYKLLQNVETFSINGTELPITKIIEGAISQFWINYFTDLRKALEAYSAFMARTSKCHLLREAWAEENRLWFVPKPEFRLRKALHNYLYSYLRHDDIDLREEQNVDDSHPVDIKIVWRMENRSAIIEVKWVGKSINLATAKITGNYSQKRARVGAKQLAEYLEDHRQEAPTEDTRGYLVIFDCRRKGLKPSVSTVTRDNGFYYDSRELIYDPAYHQVRSDFEQPIRMFLEPRCV